MEVTRPLGIRIAVEATSEIAEVLENAVTRFVCSTRRTRIRRWPARLVDTPPVLFESDDPSAQFVEAGDRLLARAPAGS